MQEKSILWEGGIYRLTNREGASTLTRGVLELGILFGRLVVLLRVFVYSRV